MMYLNLIPEIIRVIIVINSVIAHNKKNHGANSILKSDSRKKTTNKIHSMIQRNPKNAIV